MFNGNIEGKAIGVYVCRDFYLHLLNALVVRYFRIGECFLCGFCHVATGENPEKLDQKFFLTFNRNIDGKEIGTDV
jgi:hypothetical protein